VDALGLEPVQHGKRVVFDRHGSILSGA
jgi:hypothetical protein